VRNGISIVLIDGQGSSDEVRKPPIPLIGSAAVSRRAIVQPPTEATQWSINHPTTKAAGRRRGRTGGARPCIQSEAASFAIFGPGQVRLSATIAADHKRVMVIRGDGMEWDPEILARLRSSNEETSLRLKERTISRRAASQAHLPEIKMVVGDWYTDELGNRSRMIYNAKTVDFDAAYGLSPEGLPI
jgi:hypothetical protein